MAISAAAIESRLVMVEITAIHLVSFLQIALQIFPVRRPCTFTLKKRRIAVEQMAFVMLRQVCLFLWHSLRGAVNPVWFRGYRQCSTPGLFLATRPVGLGAGWSK